MDIDPLSRLRCPSRRLLCLACAAALLVAPAAHGQPASPEDMASARILGTDGVRLADSGDCPSAIAKLEAAEKLYHAPTTLERLGECQIAVGRLVAGTENLNRVVREALPPNAPPAFLVARQRAQQALTAALPRIAKLRVHVDGAPLDQVTVTVDGSKVPSALFDADRPTDPGVHEVKAAAPGFKTTAATVTLQDGAASPVALQLEPDPNAVPAAPPGAAPSPGPTALPLVSPTPGEAPPAHPSAASNRGLAIGALAVGGIGVVVGSVFGVLALSTKSTLDGVCSNKVCPRSSQSDIDALGSRATVSSIGFGVGIAGLALGAVLLVTSHGGSEAHAAARTPRGVRPWIGVGTEGVGGTFE